MKNIFDKKFVTISTHLIFWAWNIIFIILILSLVLPFMSYGIFKALFNGEIPLDFGIILTLGISIPFISVTLAFKKFLNNPEKLFLLFYGIELPLVAVLFLRLLVLRELTPGTTHLLVLFVLGTGILLYDLFMTDKFSSKISDIIKFTGHTILLLIGIYFAFIVLFYFVPPVLDFFTEILNIRSFFMSFYVLIFFLFFIISGTIIVISPIAMPYIFISNYIKSYNINILKYPKNKIIIFSSAIIILNVYLFHILNIQPQVKVFEKFMSYQEKQEITTEQKHEIIKDSRKIKKALVNAYLAPYRYLSPEKATENTIFKNFLLRPFLYQSNERYFEDHKAEQIYEKIFDTPIQKAEKKAIVHALQSRWDRDNIEAGLLNINDEKVHIDTQKINYTEKNGIAEIEIFETYTNKTYIQQEIFYYFNLPENAVITGLWLSDDNTNKKYKFTVSPRGAAQQVYKDEVTRRVDPSLLEQTGQGMYRLRAFPIQAMSRHNQNQENPIFKIWLKYICIEKGGFYTLPQLNEKRNAYFDNKTNIYINEKEIKKDKNWFPEKLSAKTKFDIDKINKNHNSYFKIIPTKKNKIEKKTNIAVIIDPTYSMSQASNDLIVSMSEFDKQFTGDIYFPEEKDFSKYNLTDFKIENCLFFGNTDEYSILEKFEKKNIDINYDAIIYITDAGTYESSNDNYTSINFKKPLYFLHLNNNFPKSYNDAVLETIKKSGGNISGNTKKLISEINFKISNKNKNLIYDADNELIWEKTTDTTNTQDIGNKLLQKIEAKKEIQYYIQNSDSINNLFLDKIHQIAVNNEIVTEYSSMIVLVNDRQKKALEEAESKDDRFDREAETGKEQLTKPSNPFNVTGTPEPEEWILIIISSLIILFTVFKFKR